MTDSETSRHELPTRRPSTSSTIHIAMYCPVKCKDCSDRAGFFPLTIGQKAVVSTVKK